MISALNLKPERPVYDMPQRHVFAVPPLAIKQKAVIFDLDGTLALHTDREWFEYAKCGSDAACRVVDTIYRGFMRDGDVAILLLTGRPETYFDQTTAWLGLMGYHWHRLYMRGATDHASNLVYKRDVLETAILPTYDVIAAFEDNPPVVDMLVKYGITVFQPRRPGKPEQYYRPEGWPDDDKEGAG